MSLLTRPPHHYSRAHKLAMSKRRQITATARPIEAKMQVQPLTEEVLENVPNPLTPEYVAQFVRLPEED